MCFDPISAAIIGTSLALNVAGGIQRSQTQNNFIKAQNRENQRAAEAAARARDLEVTRQRELREQAQLPFQDSVERVTPENIQTNIETALADRSSETDARAQRLTAIRLPGQSSDTDLNREIGAQVVDEVRRGRGEIEAINRLAAFGTAFGDVGRGLSNNALDIRAINDARRGSVAVSGQEQSILPASVRPGSTLLGDVLSGAGQLLPFAAGAAGAGGAGVSAPGTTGSPFSTVPGFTGTGGLF